MVKLVDRETLMKEREEKKKVRRQSEGENLKLLQKKVVGRSTLKSWYLHPFNSIPKLIFILFVLINV